MSDDPKKPFDRIQFRKDSDQPKTKVQFRISDDPRTVADKDGTDRKFKPQTVRSLGAASNSPMGTTPVKREKVIVEFTPEGYQEPPDQDVEISLDREDITLEYENKGLNVLLRKEDNTSEMGIDGGQISRLTITDGEIGDETVLAHFENGEWIKPPETFVEKQVVHDAKERDNGIDMRSIKPPSDIEHDL